MFCKTFGSLSNPPYADGRVASFSYTTQPVNKCTLFLNVSVALFSIFHTQLSNALIWCNLKAQKHSKHTIRHRTQPNCRNHKKSAQKKTKNDSFSKHRHRIIHLHFTQNTTEYLSYFSMQKMYIFAPQNPSPNLYRAIFILNFTYLCLRLSFHNCHIWQFWTLLT